MAEPRFSFDRRNFLRASAAGVVAATVPGVARHAAAAERAARAKSVLVVLLSGGPSQLDMFDPKPEAPAETRGEFSAIGTTIPGVKLSEHLPKLAQQTSRWSIVRTLAHPEHNHLLATHVALTGRPTPLPRGATDLDRVESRNDFPNMAAALDFVRPRNDGIPTGVSLPNYLIEGPLTWPGQHSGFLGPRHDPWQINRDPSQPDFRVDALTLGEGISSDRLHTRRSLLDAMNRGQSPLAASPSGAALGEQQEVAFSLLTSARMAQAFEINQESDETRDRYGRHKFGQSLLLSRRLIEAGVPIVQATMGIVQTWDTHVDNWGRLKNTLLPQLDQGLDALMADLAASGHLDDTLVIVMGRNAGDRDGRIRPYAAHLDAPWTDHPRPRPLGPCLLGALCRRGSSRRSGHRPDRLPGGVPHDPALVAGGCLHHDLQCPRRQRRNDHPRPAHPPALPVQRQGNRAAV